MLKLMMLEYWDTLVDSVALLGEVEKIEFL